MLASPELFYFETQDQIAYQQQRSAARYEQTDNPFG